MSSAPPGQSFYIGQRLSFSSAPCTVQYIGPVHSTPGVWLGVEWDDPSRGKHSGEHEGVKYFECKRQHSTAGSFIRPTRPRDQGYVFLDALREKYASHDSQPEEYGKERRKKQEDHHHHPIEWGGKIVEEVGFEKIRRQQAQLTELRIVLLDGCRVVGISSEEDERRKDIGPEGRRVYDDEGRKRCLEEIRDVCPNIVELDLSRTLLERWQDVVDVCAQLGKLQSLKLGGNRFFSLESGHEGDDLSVSFGGIKELGLDETFLSWENIVDLITPFTSLSTLSASFNQLSIIDRPLPGSLQNIMKITLEHNHFTALSDIALLSTLPFLESIYLNHNRIHKIKSGKATQVPRFSKSVTYIDLSYNAIRDWSFLDTLQEVFPGLIGLRVAHNPLYEAESSGGQEAMGIEESFMLTLARLPKLTSLNFSNIEKQERTNAELYYLSRIVREIESAPENQQIEIIKGHPRYEELCHLYGPPTITRKSADTIDPNSLEARLINFTFVYIAADGAEKPVIKSRKIPRGFDIYRLKGVVGRLFGIKKPMRMRLVWETGEWDPSGGDDDDGSDDGDWDEGEQGESNGEAGVAAVPKEKWVRREVELEDGTREVGFWVDGREARVRVEPR